MTLDVNNNDQFYRWILDQIQEDPAAIEMFLLQGNIVSEAMEFFNNAWIEHVEAQQETEKENEDENDG